MYIQFRDYIEELEDITSDKDFVLRKKCDSLFIDLFIQLKQSLSAYTRQSNRRKSYVWGDSHVDRQLQFNVMSEVMWGLYKIQWDPMQGRILQEEKMIMLEHNQWIIPGWYSQSRSVRRGLGVKLKGAGSWCELNILKILECQTKCRSIL